MFGTSVSTIELMLHFPPKPLHGVIILEIDHRIGLSHGRYREALLLEMVGVLRNPLNVIRKADVVKAP